jgi:hypothetical protein
MDSAMSEALSMRAEGKGAIELSRGEYNEKADPAEGQCVPTVRVRPR